MRTLIARSILLSFLLCVCAANAGLYKGLDESGNVVYSDKPFDNAEKITPPELTVVKPTKVPPKPEVSEEEPSAETKYTKFRITAPTNGQSIWNEPDLHVSLQLEPALNVAEGHNVWLLMDGKPLVKNSRSLLLQIGRADRGEHKLQAQIKNKKGKVLKRSQTVTVHIKNTVIQRTPRPTPL